MLDKEFLTFMIGKEEFGVNILSVKEIRCWTPTTTIPNLPVYFKGVINLRGVIIPIIDLRIKFNQGRVEYTDTTVLIVIQDHSAEIERYVGIVVDSVSDVYRATSNEIKAAPDLGKKSDHSFIQYMMALEDKIILLLEATALLDADKVFDEMDSIDLAS